MKLKKLKWILGLLATLAVAAVVAVYAVIANLDFEELRGVIQAQAKAATGRDLVIAGPIDVNVSLRPAITLEDVSFANAPGSAEPRMAHVARFELEVALLPLIGGTIEVERLVLVGPEILLETDAAGRGNWLLSETPGAAAAAQGGGETVLPEVRALVIRDGRLTYRDGATGARHEVTLDRLSARAESGSDPLQVSLEGRYNGTAVTLQGLLGSFEQLRGGPFPLELAATAGGAALEAKGRLDRPLAGLEGRLKLSLAGEDLSALGPLIGAALPALGPYEFAAEAVMGGDKLELSGIVARLGGSDLTGNATLLLDTPRPMIRARVLAGRLDLADFKPPGAAEAADAEAGEANFVFGEETLPLESLKAVNGELALSAGVLQLRSGLVLADLKANLTLNQGRLSLRPATAGLADGQVAASLDLDAAAALSAVAARLEARQVDYGRLLKDMAISEDIAGILDGTLDVSGAGASPRAIAAGLNGGLEVVSGQGAIDGRLMKLAAGGRGDMFSPLMSGDGTIKLNCFVARFDSRDGLAQSRAILLDTETFTVGGGGTIDLRTEELDLKFDTETREISLASLGVPFYVGGTLAKPTASLDPLGAVANPTVVATILTGPISLVGSLVAKQQLDKTNGENPCVAALSAMPGQSQSSTAGKVKSTLEGAAESVGETLEDVGQGISEGLKSLFRN